VDGSRGGWGAFRGRGGGGGWVRESVWEVRRGEEGRGGAG